MVYMLPADVCNSWWVSGGWSTNSLPDAGFLCPSSSCTLIRPEGSCSTADPAGEQCKPVSSHTTWWHFRQTTGNTLSSSCLERFWKCTPMVERPVECYNFKRGIGFGMRDQSFPMTCCLNLHEGALVHISFGIHECTLSRCSYSRSVTSVHC